MNKTKLEETLARVDALAHSGFQFGEPATKPLIETLADAIRDRSGISLPSQLECWYRWHNGQIGGNPLLPDDDRRLLSIDEAIREWDFFLDSSNEFLEPYDRHWFPVQSNGRSDYLVYDLNSGNLIAYWHDDTEREVEYISLEDWAKHVASALPPSKGEAAGLFECGQPDTLTILIFPVTGTKNLSLAREIHSLAGVPLMNVVKMLASADESSALSWNLSESTNSMERSRSVRLAGKIANRMKDEGVATVVCIRTDSESELIEPEMLEPLSLRCLAP